MSEEKQISTAEIISGLKEGEKTYRGFKRGLEVAQAFAGLENKEVDIKKSIENLERQKIVLVSEVADLKESVILEEARASKLIGDAEVKSAEIINEAQTKILVAETASQEAIEDMAHTLAAVKDEVSEAEVERDKLKAEIKELEDVKSKTRQQILDGTA